MAFVGGASGSIFAQILSCPIDVVSQHMMLAGQRGEQVPCKSNPMNPNQHAGKIRDLDRIHIPEHLKTASSYRVFKYISREIFKNENILGFYRGYMLSTFLVSLNSALWWPFYYFYQGKF